MAKLNIVETSLNDLKAHNITLMNVAELTTVTSNMFVVTGTSRAHSRALADKVMVDVKSKGYSVYGVEGVEDADWILIDLGDIIVHIMQLAIRQYYSLEDFWNAENLLVAHES